MSKARLQTSIVHTPPPTTNPQDIGSFTYGNAFLKYHIYHNATMDAYTTVVPPQYRGQKIAEKLCDAAYKYAMEQGYNVLPTCSYIASRYIPNNIDTVGNNSLLGYDSQTEGLEISVTHGGVAICRFTEPRRRNPLTKVILEKMHAFLTQCGNMEINDDEMRVEVFLKPDEVSKAIGKGGHNIKLASKLTGYEIDVYREGAEDIDDVDLDEFSDEIDGWIIDELKAIGCDSAKSVLEIGVEDLVKRTDLEEETIEEIVKI